MRARMTSLGYPVPLRLEKSRSASRIEFLVIQSRSNARFVILKQGLGREPLLPITHTSNQRQPVLNLRPVRVVGDLVAEVLEHGRLHEESLAQVGVLRERVQSRRNHGSDVALRERKRRRSTRMSLESDRKSSVPREAKGLEHGVGLEA